MARGKKRGDERTRKFPVWAIALLVVVLIVFVLAFYYSGNVNYSPVIQKKANENLGFCSIKGILEARSLQGACADSGNCVSYNQKKAEYLSKCGWELP
ncbi:hypothetical protein AUJ84_02675 [Candidatus Pacearchaeota archaeon CG1_02_32_132]|nr:MAG: hypothetical protein AUJ84_02675 [Candidatus Pacearchaeota archaeon CG1_02_32_132]